MNDPNALMWESIRTIPFDDYETLERMADSDDQTFVPVLAELLFSFVPESREGYQEIEDTLRLLTGENYDDFDWNEWVKWVGRHDEITPPPGFDGWKGQLFEKIDPSFGDFLYEGIPNRIRLEEIMWGGVRKDGIPDLRFPPNIPGDSAGYLESQDRVFGVSINGEHRAYPHRILNPHEMANDILGDEQFALAY